MVNVSPANADKELLRIFPVAGMKNSRSHPPALSGTPVMGPSLERNLSKKKEQVRDSTSTLLATQTATL